MKASLITKITARGILMLASLTACSADDPEVSADFFINAADSLTAEYIAVAGDIQQLTCYPERRPLLQELMDWLDDFDARRPGRLRAVLQTGDISETNHPTQWLMANETCGAVAARLPFIFSTGNHDYDWTEGSLRITSRRSTNLNLLELREPARRATVAQYEPGRTDNALYRLTLCGKPLMVLALEFAPRPGAVAWADSLLRAMPSERFIILNHEFLNGNGSRVSDRESFCLQQFPADECVTPSQLWERLIYPHDNVRALICGHNGKHAFRSDMNAAGRPVPQILFNLQYYPMGADGMMMLLRTTDGVNFTSAVLSTVTLKMRVSSMHHFAL